MNIKLSNACPPRSFEYFIKFSSMSLHLVTHFSQVGSKMNYDVVTCKAKHKHQVHNNKKKNCNLRLMVLNLKN
jgi:hypothetical protein